MFQKTWTYPVKKINKCTFMIIIWLFLVIYRCGIDDDECNNLEQPANQMWDQKRNAV